MTFIPGLGPSEFEPTVVATQEARQIQLSAGNEWRFEVAADTNISVKLLLTSSKNNESAENGASADDPLDSTLKGTAEIFGTELAPNHSYEFPGLTKAAIFTHHGCTLEVSGGTLESEYVAEETPMIEYTNLHFALENLRKAPSETGGPRVLLLGPENAGKTSLMKTLAAYAVRGGRTPAIVNLDPKEGLLCLPGCVSAMVMGTGALLDVEDVANAGWGSSAIGGPTPVPVMHPIVYQYGYEKPEERPDIFKPISSRLALAATSRFEEDKSVKEAGIIVDMAGSVSVAKGGYDIVQHVVSEFSINVILVLGSERLYSDMTRRFATPTSNGANNNNNNNNTEDPITVLKLPKSGGCVDRDEYYMRTLRKAQVRNYFFGGANKTVLSPHTLSVDFTGLVVLKFADPAETNLDFLPGGAEDTVSLKDSPFEASPITPSISLESTLLTLKYAAPSSTHEAIRDAPVMGYLYVSDVDDTKKRLKVLSPVAWPAGRLKERVAVAGGYDGVGGSLGGLLDR